MDQDGKRIGGREGRRHEGRKASPPFFRFHLLHSRPLRCPYSTRVLGRAYQWGGMG